MNPHMERDHDPTHECWCHPRVVHYDEHGNEVVLREGCPPPPRVTTTLEEAITNRVFVTEEQRYYVHVGNEWIPEVRAGNIDVNGAFSSHITIDRP